MKFHSVFLFCWENMFAAFRARIQLIFKALVFFVLLSSNGKKAMRITVNHDTGRFKCYVYPFLSLFFVDIKALHMNGTFYNLI